MLYQDSFYREDKLRRVREGEERQRSKDLARHRWRKASEKSV